MSAVANKPDTAAIEEWILSNVKKFVPEGVKEWWHEWRATVKDVEKQEIGDNHITQDLDKIGWGVEEAQQRHKADASESTPRRDATKTPSSLLHFPRLFTVPYRLRPTSIFVVAPASAMPHLGSAKRTPAPVQSAARQRPRVTSAVRQKETCSIDRD